MAMSPVPALAISPVPALAPRAPPKEAPVPAPVQALVPGPFGAQPPRRAGPGASTPSQGVLPRLPGLPPILTPIPSVATAPSPTAVTPSPAGARPLPDRAPGHLFCDVALSGCCLSGAAGTLALRLRWMSCCHSCPKSATLLYSLQYIHQVL